MYALGHIPEIAATALADYLAHQEHGTEKIRDMIVDDIRASQVRKARRSAPVAACLGELASELC
jgi:hypothetical protein